MINADNDIRSVTLEYTHDGDTFMASMRVSPKGVRPVIVARIPIRVEGWNAAELNEPEGIYFRDRFDALLKAATVITVRTKIMSFERIVSAVFLDDVLFAGILHEELVAFRSGEHA